MDTGPHAPLPLQDARPARAGERCRGHAARPSLSPPRGRAPAPIRRLHGARRALRRLRARARRALACAPGSPRRELGGAVARGDRSGLEIRQRVDCDAVHAHLEVEMRPGGVAGRSDERDLVALGTRSARPRRGSQTRGHTRSRGRFRGRARRGSRTPPSIRHRSPCRPRRREREFRMRTRCRSLRACDPSASRTRSRRLPRTAR